MRREFESYNLRRTRTVVGSDLRFDLQGLPGEVYEGSYKYILRARILSEWISGWRLKPGSLPRSSRRRSRG
jgi:hypothetical protein